MKRIILFFTICLISHSFASGQEKIDVIYLKNGDVVKGRIIENAPNNFVKIELENGSILYYQYFDVERFTKETKDVPSPPATQWLMPTDPYNSPNYQSQNMSERNKKKRLKFGLIGGLNMAKFIGDDANLNRMDFDENISELNTDLEFSMKYAAGSFLTYTFTDHMSIRPELLYLVKGSNYKIRNSPVTIEFTMQYLDISLLGMFVQENFNVFFGPYFGIFLDGELEISGTDGQTTVSVKFDLKEKCGVDPDDYCLGIMESSEFGLVLGSSYSVATNLSIEARYSFGLTSIIKKPDYFEDIWEDIDIKNSGFQLMASYSF